MATIGYQVGYNTFQAQLDALQSEISTAEVSETVSALPDPSTLPDGTMRAVLDASANGLPSIYIVRAGQWVQPIQATMPTISFVIQSGVGAGELPQNVVIAAGADGVLGVGWTLASAQSFARPVGIAASPLDPDDLTLGADGTGLWRLAVEVTYDSPAPAAAVLTRFVLQRDTGSGFADVPNGELMRLDQGAPASVDGITQVGLVLNITLNAADSLRVVARHDAGTSRTYVVRKYSVTLNQIAAQPT